MGTKPKHSSLIDRIVLFVAIAEPLMTIPQVYQIWSSRSATGVSPLTWLGYLLAAITWLVYGIKTKDKPLIVSSLLWAVTEGLVLIGALIF